MSITTAKELGQAIREEKDTIEIEGDLVRRVIKIKATGKIAWGVCIGALGVAITLVLTQPATTAIDISTLGTSALVKSFVATSSGVVAVSTLGSVSAVSTAIGIGVAGGGVAALNKLRDYRLEKKGNNKIILYRK